MKVLKLNSKNFEKSVLMAAKTIKNAGVLIAPTDTVYGMIANATNKKAIQKIFKIKKRPEEKGMPIFVGDTAAAKKLSYISFWQEKILKKYWFTPHPSKTSGAGPAPNHSSLCSSGLGQGGLTAVLKRKKGLPKIIFGSQKGIALRIPKNKFILALLEKINLPLTGTSANISGEPASTKIKKILAQFKNKKSKPDLIIDAGNLPAAIPSTIVDLRSKKIKILRQGELKIKA